MTGFLTDCCEQDRTRRRVLVGAAAIVAVVICAYVPALRAGFVWDDDSILTANPIIHYSNGLYRIWQPGFGVDYWPLTSTSFWLEWRLWGLNPLGYHLTNLFLHAACALLLWRVLRRLGIPGAYAAALLFALHPLNVASVAWITQRKNLVAMVFYLVSIACFLRTAALAGPGEGPGGRDGRLRGAYALSLACFVLSMMGKASSALLPVVLLVAIAWRRPLRRDDFLRVLPFALVSAVFSGISALLQHRAIGAAVRDAGWVERALGAATAVWFYLGKALVPMRLAFVYPLWTVDPRAFAWWIPLAAWFAVSALLWRRRAQWKAAFLAWVYFSASLVPVLGFVDVYYMRYSLVANQYAHIALIGVVVPAAAAWEGWRIRSARCGSRILPIAAGVSVLAGLGLLTWRECGTFRDAETLYRATLRINPGAWMAHNNLGIILRARGRGDEARAEFEAAVRLRPGWAEARFNRGVESQLEGRSGPAMEDFREALRLQPNFRDARLALAGLLASAGRVPESMVQDRLALLWADTAQNHCELGDACAAEGRKADAAEEYRAALRIDSHYKPALDRLSGVERDLRAR